MAFSDFPTADPADTAYTPVLSVGRVLIVYNTDVSWSLTLARRYARRKRIPLANLFGWAFGTSYDWYPANTAAIHTFTVAVEAACDSLGAQCVLVAPGCPSGVEIIGVFDGGSNSGGSVGVFYSGAAGYPDLAKLCSGVRQWNDLYDQYGEANMHCHLFAGTDYAWSFYRAAPLAVGFCFSEYSTFPSPARFIRNAGVTSTYQYADVSAGIDWEAVYNFPAIGTGNGQHITQQRTLDLLGNTSNRMLPYGRIGFWWNKVATYPQPDPSTYLMDFDTQSRAMEQGMRYADACSPGNRYRSPIHFQFQNTSAQDELAYSAKVLKDNGYNVTYNYTGTPSANQEALMPIAGAAFSLTNLRAGLVKDTPYHLMCGIAYPNYATTDDSPYLEPWFSSFKPTGGGGSFMGPSFGYGTALTGMKRGGASGLTNSSHITSGTYIGFVSMLYHLVKGMSWVEASFFSHEWGQQTPPIGDPLARPFPT